MNTHLRFPDGLLDPLLDQVRHHGREACETGALLLTEVGDPRVRVLALTGEDGIERGIGRFFIGASALDRLFTHAEQHGLQVRAMIHSHPEEAFLSLVDQRCTLRVPGFISAVIPTFDDPPTNPSAWGWWRWGPLWTPYPAPATDPTLPAAQIITFDAEGIRGH